jgi:hypothetical protein
VAECGRTLAEGRLAEGSISTRHPACLVDGHGAWRWATQRRRADSPAQSIHQTFQHGVREFSGRFADRSVQRHANACPEPSQPAAKLKDIQILHSGPGAR